MEFLGDRYYKLNRILLLPFGLWPYGDSCFKRIQTVFWIAVLMSMSVTQVQSTEKKAHLALTDITGLSGIEEIPRLRVYGGSIRYCFTDLFIATLINLFTMEYHLDLVLNNLSYTMPCLIYLVKYNTFYVQSRKIKGLMEQVRHHWNELSDEQEVEIMERHAKSGRIYIYAFAGLAYSSTVGCIIMSLSSNILDVVAPLNESRPRTLPFMAEYFVDEEKYFYPILLHMDVAITAGVMSFLATETMMFAYIYHLCAMFQVTSFRIRHALADTPLVSALSRENAACAKIIDAIQIHQKAIGFFEHLGSTFAVCYFILLILGIASLSINLFRLFRIAALPNHGKESLLYVVFVSGHFYYMFVCNYIGQKITDNSEIISRDVYDKRWYAASLRMQRLLLFMMQRSMRSCKFIMGGLYSLSMENFTTFASMSLSYFTVIYSMQQ